MRVPATPGYEDLKTVVLQGHMDMVPQKNADVDHDFLKDPIETWIDGEWLRAKGTTLGADDGLGVAFAMAVAESPEVKHGPIEILVTYDEETGMTGAQALKSGVLKGDILINIDSETEGELYVGCAGGLDTNASARYRRKKEPRAHLRYSLAVKGCQGGHSGMDIILCRANANRLMARVLLPLLDRCGVKLIDLEGGTLRNAIPREAFANVYVPKKKLAAAKRTVARIAKALKTLCESVTKYQGIIPSAYYESLAQKVAGYNKTYSDADDYINAIAAVNALFAEADKLLEPYADYKELYAIIQTLADAKPYKEIVANAHMQSEAPPLRRSKVFAPHSRLLVSSMPRTLTRWVMPSLT